MIKELARPADGKMRPGLQRIEAHRGPTGSRGAFASKAVSIDLAPTGFSFHVVSFDQASPAHEHSLLALFRKWDSEPDTQTEADWEQLKLQLDENRSSQRKLFPDANNPA